MDNKFKANLKAIRKEKNLTQRQIAEQLGVVESCYANWEQGRTEPDISTLRRLSLIFGVSIDYLLGLEDDFGVRVDDKEKKPDTLSAEERRLLEGYREINAAGKKLVMQTVETLRGTAAGSGRGANQSKIS